MHAQTWAKVNARVDVGVRDLVEALSRFPRLETIESCEGDGESGAWVCFGYGEGWEDDWRQPAEFALGFLAPRLFDLVGDGVIIEVRPHRGRGAIIDLTVHLAVMDRVRLALHQLSAP